MTIDYYHSDKFVVDMVSSGCFERIINDPVLVCYHILQG